MAVNSNKRRRSILITRFSKKENYGYICHQPLYLADFWERISKITLTHNI